jgi:hypothetical protein
MMPRLSTILTVLTKKGTTGHWTIVSLSDSFFFFFFVVWGLNSTQGLHLEPLHQLSHEGFFSR